MNNTINFSLIALNSKFIHSNLAVRYIRSYLNKKGIDANILEFSINDSFDKIIKHIYLSNSKVLAFSCYIWNREFIMKLGPSLKKIMPDSIIVLGGPEVSYDVESTMKGNPWIDYIIFGEGEETFYQFASHLLDKDKDIKNIDGLAYNSNGMVYVNNTRSPLANLDEIPFPYDNFNDLKNKIIYYETSRGCPFTCQYCLSSIEPGVRYFSLDRVYRDIDIFINNNVKQVKLVDRTFNCNKKRSVEIMEYILSKNGSTNFHFEISAKLIDSDFLNTVKKAPKGIFQFEIGVQSTNEDTLETITRNESFKEIRDNINKIIDLGNCHIHLDLIAGLPYEDIKSFEKSFNDVYSLKPQMLQLGFLKLLRGSKLRIDAEKHGILYNQHPPYEVLSTKWLSYDDVLDLKVIEELVEIFNNSSRFTRSLDYLMKEHYNNPFVFFKELGCFYLENHAFDMPLKVSEHYELLYKFVSQKTEVTPLFNELIKFDFFKSTGNNMPSCIKRYDHSKIKNSVNNFLKNEEIINNYMPELKSMDLRQKLKYIRFEVFDVDIIDSMQEGKHIVFNIKDPTENVCNRFLSFDIDEFLKLSI
ncbi:B12-binding domain-containing radical SAM protein [Lutispora sp.]|uniref:B12-binding domain-containing radical SAM protein n=1 Tax=Lutispora sp. TaxID=2828727 RepID=UPI0035613D29